MFERQHDAEDFLEGIEASKNDNSFIDPKAGRETLPATGIAGARAK